MAVLSSNCSRTKLRRPAFTQRAERTARSFSFQESLHLLSGSRKIRQCRRQKQQARLGTETMGEKNDTWAKGAEALLPETIQLRRQIHENPELGLDLPQTTQSVLDALKGLDVKIERGRSTSGLMVTLKGPSQGGTVLLRGDMDALPMHEDTGLSFASKHPGRMHACGHDAHTAMLAGAVKLLHANRARLAGSVKFMFQPGEEGYHGALRMIEDGLLDGTPKPDAAFAIHVSTNAPAGIVTSKSGPIMASTDEVQITVWGKGGHAALPYLALDPVPIAAEIVMALQA